MPLDTAAAAVLGGVEFRGAGHQAGPHLGGVDRWNLGGPAPEPAGPLWGGSGSRRAAIASSAVSPTITGGRVALLVQNHKTFGAKQYHGSSRRANGWTQI